MNLNGNAARESLQIDFDGWLRTQWCSLFGWLVADGWCWFVLREKYCWLVAGGWFVLREKYYWLVADKPSEQGTHANANAGAQRQEEMNISACTVR
jgi:hypothetical protein